MRLLRQGCLGTTQYLATTQSDYFGFAEVGRLAESPEALACYASSSPLVVPLRVGDCLAVVLHNEGTTQLEVRVGICVRKFDRAKGSKKREEGYQKRLRLMRPHSIVLVLLPSQLAKSFFPQIEQHLGDHYGCPVALESRACAQEETWPLAGLNLVARTMSANDIVVAVSARPERLPGGLGIMCIEKPLETPDEFHQTQLKDTLMRVLERKISPRTLELGIDGEEWFRRTAIGLAEDRDGHIVGVLIALLMAAATGRMLRACLEQANPGQRQWR